MISYIQFIAVGRGNFLIGDSPTDYNQGKAQLCNLFRFSYFLALVLSAECFWIQCQLQNQVCPLLRETFEDVKIHLTMHFNKYNFGLNQSQMITNFHSRWYLSKRWSTYLVEY